MKFQKFKVYFANANGEFDHLKPVIEPILSSAESYAVPKLQIDNQIDVIVTGLYDGIQNNSLPPDEQIGGVTYAGDFLALNVNTQAKTLNPDALFTLICHELTHLHRRGWAEEQGDVWLNGTDALIDHILVEGLAVAFEKQSAEENHLKLGSSTEETISASPAETKQIFMVLKPYFSVTEFSRDLIFRTGGKINGGNLNFVNRQIRYQKFRKNIGKETLPAWAGYKLGFALVREYLDIKHQAAHETVNIKLDKLKKFHSIA